VQQLPDPSMANELGVIPYLLVLVTFSGVVTIGFFLRRITQAMDRMAAAQERTPVIVAELKATLEEKMERHEEKLDEAVLLAREHVRIARMWERTEAPGRAVRPEALG
jgi:hypothetical protein